MDHQSATAPARLMHGYVDPHASGNINKSNMNNQNISHSSKAKAPVPISTYSNDAADHRYNRHRHNHRHLQQQTPQLYGECLRNHAAALGGHALDGCGEFMPSPSSDPALPTSLTCAACGCHRNFHRRMPLINVTPTPVATAPLPQSHQPASFFQYRDGHGDDDDEEEEEQQEEREVEEDDGNDSNEGSDRQEHRSSNNSSANTLSSSAPHMLMALSAGLSNPPPADPAATQQRRPYPSELSGQVLPRKRFRTRFSPEQKEKMQELSEHLGWRIQKHDEAVVEERCRQIGVGKGVFKVWMHNNKHNGNRGPKANDATFANANGGAVRDSNNDGSPPTAQGFSNARESNGGHTLMSSSSSPPPHS